jgi:hypothetical protein
MHAYHLNECSALDSIIQLMTAERLLESEKSAGENIRTCSGINSIAADVLDILNSEVMELELRAMFAWMHADDAAAERYLKQAVRLESSGSFLYGPPSVVKPSYELYGESERKREMQAPKPGHLIFFCTGFCVLCLPCAFRQINTLA